MAVWQQIFQVKYVPALIDIMAPGGLGNGGSDVESSNLTADAVDERALLRKIDLRLVPYLSLLYLLLAFPMFERSRIITMGIDGPLYGLALNLPSIIKQLGYTSTRAQLLSVPPYVIACIATISVGYAADKTGRRGLFSVISLLTAMSGFIMNIIPSRGPAVRYVGTFLAAGGVYPCIGNTIAWTANNVEGSYKRGIVMAMVIAWGNLQGAVSSNIYRAKDAPHYLIGNAVSLANLSIALAATIFLWLGLAMENRKRDRGERKYRIKTGTEEERIELGDFHPDFRYTT
ncbi:hypothetical protein R1sor_025244 [Riccia sorocarpa]|uniref:Major facilitator superfamily (MFS) profile domain-containing protein n=1 Tax=Riccia sorocarpa TaxID=122646 RepID=A0ABD3GBQ6_9MARC